MARKKKFEQSSPEEHVPRPGLLVKLNRLVMTLIVLIIIVYGALLAASRTDGFRGLIRDELETRLGLPMKLQKAWLDPSLDLHLRGLDARESAAHAKASLQAESVAIQWAPWESLRRGSFVPVSLTLQTGSLAFAATVSGAWEPSVLSSIGADVAEWLNMDVPRKSPPASTNAVATNATEAVDAADLKAFRLGTLRIELQDSELVWWGSTSQELARVSGVNLSVTPNDVPNRRLTHYLLGVREASASSGFLMRGITMEMIDTGDKQVVLQFDGARVKN